ncbi:MAG: hypothetical protein GY771_15030 [bacterium]|nr:hypothetical protein [bacterium]
MTRTVKNVITILLPLATVFYIGCNPTPPERTEDDGTLHSYYATGWAVGHWVRYDYSKSGVRSSLYIALTDSEMMDGKTYFWLEAVQRNGTTVIATRQLIPDSSISVLENASGGLLPGAKRFIIKRGNVTSIELSPTDVKNNDVIDLKGIFAVSENVFADVEVIKTEYSAKSGKRLDCVSTTYRHTEGSSSVILDSVDVPISGIAYSKLAGGELELVDFGYSGADSVF